MAIGKQNAPAPVERRRISMKLDNFSAGGILPEGDYRVKESGFVLFTYTSKDGVAGATTTALRLLLVPYDVQGAKDAGEEIEQHWSVGNPEFFVPSEDGNFLEAVGSRQTLAKGSNYHPMYESLVNAGLPEDKWDDEGAQMLVEMIGHIKHIPAPDRSNFQQQSAVGTGAVGQQPQKKKYDPTIPVFKTIITAPWDKKGGAKAAAKPAAKAASKPAAKPAAAAAAEPESDVSRLAGYIKDAVIGAGGTMGRTKCRLEVHRRYNSQKIDAAERDADLAAFNDDSQLNDVLANVSCTLSADGSNIEYVE